jgi:hypothetical protein
MATRTQRVRGLVVLVTMMMMMTLSATTASADEGDGPPPPPPANTGVSGQVITVSVWGTGSKGGRRVPGAAEGCR